MKGEVRMAKKPSEAGKWSPTKFVTAKISFQDDPDVHSYLSSAPANKLSEFLRIAIRYYLTETKHPAATREFQRQMAHKGLDAILYGQIAEAPAGLATPEPMPAASNEADIPSASHPRPTPRVIGAMMGDKS